MVFLAVTLEQTGIALIAAIVLAVAVWFAIARFFGGTRLGRRAGRFLEAGDAEMAPEDKVKYQTRHPGAGGFG